MSEFYRLIVLGGEGVGKSSLTFQFIQNRFIDDYDPTIEDSFRKSVIIDNEACLLEILDTSSQEEFSSMRGQYIRNGDGFICVYSITSRSSFDEMNYFKEEIRRTKEGDSVPMIIAGNKCDLETERQVIKTEGEELAKYFNCIFRETSAKSAVNVEVTFYDVVREIRKNKQAMNKDVPDKDGGKKGGCSLL